MKISRDFTLLIHFFFNQLVPPLLSDSKWFMWLPFKLLLGDKAETCFSFTELAPHLNDAEFCDVYRETATVHIQ